MAKRLAPETWSVSLRSKEALHYNLLAYYDFVNEHRITPTLENFEKMFKEHFNRILFIKDGDKIQVSHFGYVGAVIDTTKNEISIYELNKEPSVLVTIKLQPKQQNKPSIIKAIAIAICAYLLGSLTNLIVTSI